MSGCLMPFCKAILGVRRGIYHLYSAGRYFVLAYESFGIFVFTHFLFARRDTTN